MTRELPVCHLAKRTIVIGLPLEDAEEDHHLRPFAALGRAA